MPVGFNSPARNIFLLGSTGVQIATNFFKTIQTAGTDGSYEPDEIKYNSIDQKFLFAGSALDSQSKRVGWFEKRNGQGVADWEVRVEAGVGINTFLRAMELDINNNLIVVGETNSIPWIAKYSNSGVINWQSTTFSGDVAYFDVASDSNGQYYACGQTPTNNNNSVAFVEKFDANGNPGWGKSAMILNGDIRLEAIESNSRGEVVAGGRIQDETRFKAYLVKIDTNTGEVLWDRTITSFREDSSGNPEDIFIKDVYIDSKDQIYVVGRITTIGTTNRSFIIKYTPEGNIIWQKETEQNIEYYQVKSDGETEQTVVFGVYQDIPNANEGGILSKYSKDGSLVWRRTLFSSFNNSDTFGERGKVNLDADPSSYYLLYTDGPYDTINRTPKSYTYGKVSSSGNGLGGFQYVEGTGQTINYEILNIQDKIGRLSDGSVRNDASDLVVYPFGGNQIVFDDLATLVTNKKRQMDSAGSFEYSGSPAIRPADFQELNLLGDVYSGSGNWLDQSGKGNDGVVNGATYNAAGYWEFDGVDDEITIDNITHGTSALTYECWVRTANGYSPSDYVSLMSTYDPNPEGFWIQLNPINAYVTAGNDGSTFHVSSTTVADGNWHHVVATYDNPNVRIYVDGVDVGGLNNAPNNNIPTRTLRIGSISLSGSASRFLDGDIGEARVYPRALTAAQVFQNYNATREKYTGVPASTNPGLTSTRTPA